MRSVWMVLCHTRQMWCGVVWSGVVWCDVMWCDMWCDMWWCDVMTEGNLKNSKFIIFFRVSAWLGQIRFSYIQGRVIWIKRSNWPAGNTTFEDVVKACTVRYWYPALALMKYELNFEFKFGKIFWHSWCRIRFQFHIIFKFDTKHIVSNVRLWQSLIS